MRHLLTHTSGLSGREGLASFTREDTSPDAIERMVRALASAQLVHPVGDAYEYANANYAVAGLIVETVSGQPYEEYVQQQILAPLQTGQSFPSPEAARPFGLAEGHQYWFGQARRSELPYPRGLLPAGFLVSSAEDMGRYLIAHLNGGRVGDAQILSPERVAELHRPGFAIDEGLWAGEVSERLITRSPDVTRIVDRLEKRAGARAAPDSRHRGTTDTAPRSAAASPESSATSAAPRRP